VASAAPPVAPPAAGAAATEAPATYPDTFSHAHATDATGADPSVRADRVPSADERGT